MPEASNNKPEEKKEEKGVTKKYSLEETENMLSRGIRIADDPAVLLMELGEMFPKYLSGTRTKEDAEKLRKDLDDRCVRLMRLREPESQIALMESFNPEYRGLAKEFTSQLIREYKCNTQLEKAVAGVVSNAYIRILDNSRRLNNDLGGPGISITENKTKYLAMLSMQLDRANRQFTSSLMVLKQMKTPAMEINVKAKTAFVSQNQQFNVNKDENIKPE